MEDIPKKLAKHLQQLDAVECEQQKQMFYQLLAKAETEHFQSPRFWAMRQILAGRTMAEINRKITKKLKLNKLQNCDC